MSRFKFRLWNKRESRMISADEATHDYTQVLAIGLHGLPIAVDRDSFKPDGIVGWNVEHYLIPMQFTGLKDSDGKEIYDGDIVHISWAFDEFKARVFWGKSRPLNSWDSGETWMLHFNGLPDEREGPLFPYCEGNRGGHKVHVIGNIYEHPTLAEEHDNG